MRGRVCAKHHLAASVIPVALICINPADLVLVHERILVDKPRPPICRGGAETSTRCPTGPSQRFYAVRFRASTTCRDSNTEECQASGHRQLLGRRREKRANAGASYFHRRRQYSYATQQQR